MTDLERGRDAVQQFVNASWVYPAFGMKDVEDVGRAVLPADPNIFFDGFGFAINSSGLSDWTVHKAMSDLATKAQGKIPNRNAFFNALVNQAQNLGIDDYVLSGDGAVTVIEEAASGVKQVGDVIITSAQSLKGVAPLLIVAAVIFIGWSYVKKVTA